MADELDPLDDLGTPACAACGTLMETAGDARELAVADALVVTGSAYWRCPACGFVSLV